jgi:hypothetical protein
MSNPAMAKESNGKAENVAERNPRRVKSDSRLGKKVSDPATRGDARAVEFPGHRLPPDPQYPARRCDVVSLKSRCSRNDARPGGTMQAIAGMEGAGNRQDANGKSKENNFGG